MLGYERNRSNNGLPGSRSVLWKNAEIVDLGTLGEDFGCANALNNRGQVVGFSLNGFLILSPYSSTQHRAGLFCGKTA
jgi:hypothetical protein